MSSPTNAGVFCFGGEVRPSDLMRSEWETALTLEELSRLLDGCSDLDDLRLKIAERTGQST